MTFGFVFHLDAQQAHSTGQCALTATEDGMKTYKTINKLQDNQQKYRIVKTNRIEEVKIEDIGKYWNRNSKRIHTQSEFSLSFGF